MFIKHNRHAIDFTYIYYFKQVKGILRIVWRKLMKILHLNLGCFYIDNYGYQENILPMIHKHDGHEVMIVASTFTFKDNIGVGETSTGRYYNENDILVERLPYKKYLPKKVMNKIRDYEGIKRVLYEFIPDVIFVHGFQSLSMNTVVKYKKNNPKVRIYVDSHADFYTSGTTFFSKRILHGFFYKNIVHRVLKYIEKIFYISKTCGTFLTEVYKIPEDLTEFYSLGGIIPNQMESINTRKQIRRKLRLSYKHVMFLQAGKIDERKKLLESLREFSAIKDSNFRYVVIGSISDALKEDFNKYLELDDRIIYLGWKDSSELQKYLCACDVYIQPGKPSAIMQNAICNSCPVILNHLVDYEPFVKSNGWLIENTTDLYMIFNSISDDKDVLLKMRKESLSIAEELLDYRKLAKRIY